jgi:hypothetical protein
MRLEYCNSTKLPETFGHLVGWTVQQTVLQNPCNTGYSMVCSSERATPEVTCFCYGLCLIWVLANPPRANCVAQDPLMQLSF